MQWQWQWPSLQSRVYSRIVARRWRMISREPQLEKLSGERSLLSTLYSLIRLLLNALPVLLFLIALIVPPDLIALVIHNKNHAHRSERGRNDEDQNPAF